MTRFVPVITVALSLVACAAAQPARPAAPPAGKPAGTSGKTDAANEAAGAAGEAAGAAGEAAGAAGKQGSEDGPHEFKYNQGSQGQKRGVKPSTIRPTLTKAALKFTVVDKVKGPITGIVIKLNDGKGGVYYTEETDAKGYAEVLVRVGQKYEVVYLSLGRKTIGARLSVSDEPSQTIRLTLRYKRYVPPNVALVLEGVEFDTGRASLRPLSFEKLDRVVEYMRYKKSARIEISGHTDNVGNRRRNKTLSTKRAEACRKYLLYKGVDAGRVQAVGYGQERPIASNKTQEGRQKNRRIQAVEL